MSIACENNSITDLKIMGDKLASVSEFNGFAVPNRTLSDSFSMDSFVTTLTRLTSLRVLSLVSLGIWGPVPDKIHRLSSLELLDMSSNFMFGSIPPQLSRLVKLRSLTLDSNFFNDTVPDWFDSLSNLTILSLKNNRLKGQFPSSICRLTTLTAIALSHNRLSGLATVLLSKNSLSVLQITELLSLMGIACLLLPNIRRYRSRGTLEHHTLPKVVQDNSPGGISSELLANARLISQAAKLGTQGAPVCRLFSLEELAEATSNFDQSTFLGEGSIGKLYKGKLENGTYVAIRSLTLFRKYSIRNLKHRLDLLSKLRHPHLVGLVGHCIDGSGQEESTANRVFLVYEYIPNGNFRTHLSESFTENALKWSDRLAVVIGVAKAVHFLHTGVIPASFSNRLKTNNILLDEHRIAKLSDYGMSIITEEIEKLEAKGDEPKSWHMTKLEDDVYNFGFILLESLVGPIVSGKGEGFLLKEMASFGSQDGRRRIVDPIVLTTSSQESLSIVISITNKCISPESSIRPSFEDVLWNLQYAAQLQATADADQKSDAASQS
ncbi:hypothetical protein F0562_004522 [Nyssa sinensis]|uniref:Protein kinase domain-containing protein n=1 Tax=Nyssa sinensis TaxID=561372 RepID=A0A5J5C2Q2_9ASTE|nr:hypothetical protein F0562_004522 [Nyssa sinensis]